MTFSSRFLVLIFLSSTLLACGGGGGGGDGGSGAGASGGGGGGNLYAMVCGSGSSDVLEGCWEIETCEFTSTDTNGVSYWIKYVIDFRADSTMTEHVQTYTDSGCSGAVFATSDLPFISDYAIGAAYLSSGGLDSNYLAKTWHVGNSSGTDYTGFHITATDRLCFAGNNLNWSAAGGGLGTTAQSTAQVPTNINTTLCMVRS